MTKRSADLASTSNDEAKRQNMRLPDGYMVNIQAKTSNDGHQAAHEVSSKVWLFVLRLHVLRFWLNVSQIELAQNGQKLFGTSRKTKR
jgi:hypothetical protein